MNRLPDVAMGTLADLAGVYVLLRLLFVRPAYQAGTTLLTWMGLGQPMAEVVTVLTVGGSAVAGAVVFLARALR